jgi:enoyl-CoA hydratase/carnithine racemase
MTQSRESVGRFVSLVRSGDGVAKVLLDRGDGLNALSQEVLRDLRKAAKALRGDTAVHAVILAGVGPFSAGADLVDPALADRAKAGLLERRELLRAGPDACEAWAALDQVTICAIERFCIGGGVSLAVSCDFRIMAADAHMRLPEIPLGMNMSWHTLPRLTALVGPSRTKQMTIFGERIAAAVAAEWGLVDRVCAPGDALGAALEWARKAADLPPVAVRMSKRTISELAHLGASLASHMDTDQFALASQSQDFREAVSAFLEKRKPVFTGS